MSAARQYLRSAGQPQIIVDPNGQPVQPTTSIQIAPASNPGVTQVPTYDANGQIVKDASGNTVMQSVPSDSPLAKAQGGWMRGGTGMLLGALAIAALAFGGSYAGTHYAMKRASRSGSSHGRRARSVLPT